MLIHATLAAGVLFTLAAPVHADDPPADGKQVVLFVCEHGAAKSVMAAAHFNKRAKERKLPYRAVAKGTSPQEQLSESAVKGLAAEELAALPSRPEQVTAADVAGAARVVTFGCDISKVAPGARPESWADVPGPSEDYAASRQAIDRHLDALLAELDRAKK
jgi:arsenate reductase (thioredoxin)